MATENAFPSLGTVQARMTAGERRLYQQLQKKLLPDDWFWYDQPMKQRGAWADFVILSPEQGILLLEVKDWKAETILSADPENFEIQTPQGPKRVANPRQQAWRNLLALVQRLQKDPVLVQKDGAYRGNLAFNYAHGVVFPNLTRKRFEALGLDGVMPAEQVLCADEMTGSIDAGAFRQRLWGMCEYRFQRPLSPAMVDRVRWHLFPEVRVGQQTQLFDDVEALPLDEQIRLLDRKQERLARSLGDGHRVIHGVSGSGKTLVLMTRARLLAQAGVKPVALVCFNRTLAKVLRDRVADDSGAIEVLHYHGWVRQRLEQTLEALQAREPRMLEYKIQQGSSLECVSA
ncbi:Part of AAA domain-containing protein [Sulfurivirga caldicuralii]|uniref:Part of AAA domain-containing protein n=1 Tax=Sulfurivirga caldicuralii TaxID=364032 RepID=A0A1N6GX69_9GAMM|nr:nuclease-related domain-containing protein [Sulfurivirga caldicuralii]SIO12148.1 Part of AAA domain-containing protein [Sulfurivirga caldicuralii]